MQITFSQFVDMIFDYDVVLCRAVGFLTNGEPLLTSKRDHGPWGDL